MNYLSKTFENESIISELCRQRMKLAEHRHKNVLPHLISKDHPAAEYARPEMAADLKGLFPPRRKWDRFRPLPDKRKRKSGHDINAEALRSAVRHLMLESPESPWVQKLHDRVAIIKSKALDDPNLAFSPPNIFGELKKTGGHDYRPISMYATDECIIHKLAARYLTDRLDPFFSTSSLAYRGRPTGAESPINRDTALHRIDQFRKQNQRVYVAEADFRNFMDCIDHVEAIKSLEDLIKQARERQPDFEIDPRAIQIFKAYLESYSFKNVVLGKGLAMLKEKDSKAVFPWPVESLRAMHGDNDLDRIGIPQGGALSCLITNLIMHAVDQAVDRLNGRNGHKVLYLRFCDDMLILSTDIDACKEAMKTYRRMVTTQMLPMHEPVDVFNTKDNTKIKSNFLDLKSKNPYLWSHGADRGIPWVQFLGFEIHYDREVRIRTKSLKKQLSKMTFETDKLLRVIGSVKRAKDGRIIFAPSLRMDPSQILHRHEMKLVAMSVGRRKFGQPLPKNASDIMPMCWANGYKALWQAYAYNPAQLKQLDRHREQQLKRVRCKLKPLLDHLDSNPSTTAELKKKRYHGANFSYHGQFANKAGSMTD